MNLAQRCEGDRGLTNRVWNDATIGIEWPDAGMGPVLSAKDELGVSLNQAETFD